MKVFAYRSFYDLLSATEKAKESYEIICLYSNQIVIRRALLKWGRKAWRAVKAAKNTQQAYDVLHVSPLDIQINKVLNIKEKNNGVSYKGSVHDAALEKFLKYFHGQEESPVI